MAEVNGLPTNRVRTNQVAPANAAKYTNEWPRLCSMDTRAVATAPIV